jgi:hypothetical protein
LWPAGKGLEVPEWAKELLKDFSLAQILKAFGHN